MPELATLGIIVDATGARREIQLTRDELIKLADGGREAEAVLKNIVPPNVVPPAVAPSINRVTEAMQRMQAAAAQSGANAMASQLQRLDPFQQQAAASAQKTTMNFNHLRQGLTTLAVQAGAIPGPIGRIASSLAPMAIGGGVTVGVLAGLAALSFAWKKFSEDADRAREMMLKIHAMEGQFGPAAMVARSGALQAQEGRLAGRLDALQSMRGNQGSGLTGAIMGIVNVFQSNKVSDELAEVRERLATLNDAIAKFTRDLQQEALDAKKWMTQTVAVARFERGADFARARPFAGPHAGIDETAFAANQRIALTFEIEAAKARREYAGDALKAKLDILGVEKETNKSIAEGARLDAHRLATAQQKVAVGQHVAQWGLSKVDPMFGQVLQIGTSIASANWLGAAQGVTSLVDSIIDLGAASREQARGIIAEIEARRSFQDSLRVAMGEMTETEFKIAEANRRFAAERANFSGSKEELDRMSELQRRYVEWLTKEGDQKERLNAAMRNAPSGFFVERYLQRLGSGLSAPAVGGPGPTTTYGPSSGASSRTTINVVMPPGAIVIDGNQTPMELAKQLVAGIRQWASVTGGTGMTASQALNVVPVS